MKSFKGRTAVITGAASGFGLETARLAAEQGRDVFAIPGSIHAPQARGCHQLIRDGAKLVETAADILDELRLAPREAAPARDLAPEEGGGDEARVMQAMGHDPVDVDTLVQRTTLTAEALYAILLALELDGRVSRLPGGRLQRL